MDLFHNFKQGWNETRVCSPAFSDHTKIKGEPPVLKGKGRYTAQILRTWRDSQEFGINDFYVYLGLKNIEAQKEISLAPLQIK